jgi:predicted nuclease of predicted toxin-antitoxin system
MAPPPWAFLLDENMPKRAATALRKAGYSVARVIEVGLRAKEDPAIFAYARRHGLIIVTRDADFLASQYQPPHAGIILLSLPGVPGRAVVDPLMAAITSLRGQDLINKVYLVGPGGLHVIRA